tara:strand:- start:81 stop:656 length:576 start_codon:yes stop_codon:yes gene_type:complete
MATAIKYSTRTCSRCGAKKLSNKIYKKTVERSYSGSSRRSINIFTWIGFLLGDKGALRAIKQYLFQSSNRKYGASSTKEINLCSLCFHRVPSVKSKGIYKIIFFPFFIFYIPAKFLLTSPLIRELVIYIFGIVVWLTIKLLKMLRFFGIKILDQDGDGDLDKKDLEIAYQKVSTFFSRFKGKNKLKKEDDV